MGIGEKLKDIYYLGEEKWYSFLDKADEHLPVYKIIDPIDNVIPSFALFLIIIFLVLLLTITGLFGIVTQSQATLKLSIVDSDGGAVSEAKVIVQGIDRELISNEFGLVEAVTVPFNTTIEVTAQKGDKQTTVPVLIDEFSKVEEIILSISAHFISQKSIRFETGTGETATGEMTLSYRCSSGSEAPQEETIYNGTTNVSYTEECGTLTVTVSSPKYETKSFTLTAPASTFTLSSKEPKEIVKVTINLKLNGVLITEPVTVQAFTSENTYIPTDTKQANNGQATFDLAEGDYKFRVRQEQGYKQKETTITSITKAEGQKTIDIAMEKNFIGYIKAQVYQGLAEAEDAYITLSKKVGDTYVEVINRDTNGTGEVLFEIAEEGSYLVMATKEGYCDATKDANIGDSVILNMVKDIGQCGNKLKARVIDQDGKPVAYAKVALFGSKEEDEYKLAYQEKLTDFNGYVEWNPISNSKTGETYKVFAFKATYSGWSEAKEFNAKTAVDPFIVSLEIPLGTVKVTVKDIDNLPIQFAEVQLFDEYIPLGKVNNPASGKKMVENLDGTIEFNIKSDKKVYAVIKKEGYESYTTIPKQTIGAGTINFEINLSKPPADELKINFLGLYKNDARALKVEPGQEYDALFEVISPKDYDELGFFVRMGKDNVTKTELDKIFIKDVIAPAKKMVTTGATYNKPKGYSTDEKYLNLEESKWAEVRWLSESYVPGKIIVGVKVKIRPTAQAEERIDIGYRAWGAIDGEYERDLADTELGTNQSSSVKQELYASTKEAYVSVGTETLCENPTEEKSFCITSTFTDPENFTQTFTDSFEAKNNSKYGVSIKVMNNSLIGFDRAKTLLENPEENLYLGTYSILTPKYAPVQGTVNAYKTEWIDTPGFVKNSSIDIVSVDVTPQKTGTGTIKLRIREDNSLVFEKSFTVNVGSDKKMNVKFMKGTEFTDDMPKIVSGKPESLTVKVFNTATGIEVEGAIVKIYDRFGTKLLEKTTNKLGLATLSIPASFPGEKLKLQIEKPEYETLVKEFNIAEDVIDVTPDSLSFTVNPQTKLQDIKTVKIENKTGLDLAIISIKLTGKLKGVLNEAQIESWFNNYIGTKIKSQDYEEFDFKVISANIVPTAEDLEGKFEITVGAEGKEWTKEIEAKIRVGLGKDVDNPSCLEITQTNWEAVTRGNQIETSFEIKNNCIVEGKPVSLKNLGATISSTGTIGGTFNAQSKTVQVELGTAYARVFKTILNPGEKVPVTIKFAPAAGSSGTATGSIIFEAQNQTDSKSQTLTAEMKYNIIYENLQDCIVLGADLITISAPGTGSFSITNSCKTKADFQIDTGDLQGAISNKTFSLNAGENKDVTVTASEGQIPGAYNLLVYGRQKGTTLELIGNVKVIIEDAGSCFTLSRYEYDVYDSQFNEFDGIDRGYLRNNCVQKTTTASVTGEIPYDNARLWKMALMGAITGGIAGYIKQPDSNTSWFKKKGKENNSQWNNRVEVDLQRKGIENYTEYEKNAQGYATIDTKVQKANLDTKKNGLNDMINTLSISSTTPAKVESVTIEQLGKLSFASTADAQKEVKKKALISKIKKLTANIDDSSENIDKTVNKYNAKYKEINTTAKKSMDNLKADFKKQFDALGKKINAGDNLDKDQEALYQNMLAEYNTKLIEIKKEHLKQVGESRDAAVKSVQDLGKIHDNDYASIEKEVKEYLATSASSQPNVDKVSFSTQCSDFVEGMTSQIANLEKDLEQDRVYLDSVQATANTTKGRQLYSQVTTELASYKKEFGAAKTSSGTAIQNEEKLAELQDSFESILSDWIDLGLELNIIVKEVTTKQAAKPVPAITPPADKTSSQTSGSNYNPTNVNENSVPSNVTSANPVQPSTPSSSNKDLSAYYQHTTVIVPFFNEQYVYYKVDSTTGKVYKADMRSDSEAKYWVETTDFTAADLEAGVKGNTVKRLDSAPNTVPKQTSTPTGQFILASSNTGTNNINKNRGSDNYSTALNALMQGGMGFGAGMMTSSWWGGALAGAATTFMWEWLNAQNTEIDYSDTFAVPLVEIKDVALQSADGVQMVVGEVSYDYDNYYGMQSTGTSNTTDSTATDNTANNDNTKNTTNNSQYTGNVLYNPQALSATMGQVEIRELEFSNPGQVKNKTAYQPFVGLLTVTGEEKVYETDYNYEYVKQKAIERGEELEKDNGGGIWGSIKDLFSPPGASNEEIAAIDSNDLVVKELRAYAKKFHLLFDAYEYVDCGPNTYPCQVKEISNCDVDGKKGVTGTEAVPKIKLAWNWDEIDMQECDSENNANYVYCDSTQFSISTLKKIMYLQEFFKTHNLSACPTAIDIVGTKTQKLSENSLDVGITSIVAKPAANGASLETTVETNNNIEMSAKLTYKFTRQDGTEVVNVCAPETKSFTSGTKYICSVDTNKVGTGTFNVDIAMEPTLCKGCENNLTTNDTIKTALVLGSSGAAACREYKTNRDYFEKVLAANNLLDTEEGKAALEAISFKTNLVRDGFSADFKNDFDAFLSEIAAAPVEYKQQGIEDLFLSDKFKVTWPTKPTAWEPGKYDATITIKFANSSWQWDNNNIESITIDLAPQGEPDPFYPIYNVAFDGVVGMNSDDGRNGYGAGYIQKTEDLFVIATDGHSNVIAQPNARSNAVTNVSVSVIKGTQAFNQLNSSPTRGNVLSISRTGDDVDFVITPSVAVPLILNISRDTSTDAFAFYSAEVNGQPQETGSSFISWTGIGQGCVTFDGSPMSAYYNTPDSKASGIMTGYDGYGLGWPMATVSGTASFYGSFFAPQNTSTIVKVTGAKDTASFESTYGNGSLIQVSTTGEGIKTLKNVIDLVKQEKVCVIGGDYYWNNTGLREEMKGNIDAKENTCIASR